MNARIDVPDKCKKYYRHQALDFYEIHWSVNEDDLVIHISKVRAESVPTALRIHIKRPKNKKQIYYVYEFST